MRRLDHIRKRRAALAKLVDRHQELATIGRAILDDIDWLIDHATFVDDSEVQTDDLEVPE